jgi:hypothetical protein
VGCSPKTNFITSIVITAPVDECFVGDAINFSATVYPATAKDKTITWSVTPSGATINDSGTFNSTTAGDYSVQATAKDKGGIKSNSFIIKAITRPHQAVFTFIDFINSLKLNYSFNIETGTGNNENYITEYGLYNLAFNDNYGSLARGYNDKFYPVLMDLFNDTVKFAPSRTIDLDIFKSFFEFDTWFEGDTTHLYEQLTYDQDKNSIYMPIKGKYSDSFQFMMDHSSIGDFFLDTTIGDGLGDYIIGFEVELTPTYEVELIKAVLRPDTIDAICMPSYLEVGEKIGFILTYFDIGSTELICAKDFYDNGTLPQYANLNTWDEVYDDFTTKLDTVFASEDVTRYMNAITSKLPIDILGDTIDNLIEFEPESFHYFTRITIYIFNVGRIDAENFGTKLDTDRKAAHNGLLFNEVFGHQFTNDPYDLWVAPVYNIGNNTFSIDFHFQKHEGFTQAGIDVGEYLSETYGTVTIPDLPGAAHYAFSPALVGFGYVTIAAFFKLGVDIKNINGSNIINVWSSKLVLNGWHREMTSLGWQLQDPERRIGIVFNYETFFEGFTVIWMDFNPAATPAKAIWPSDKLNENHSISLPELPVNPEGGYVYTYTAGEEKSVVLIIDPVFNFKGYAELLTAEGWKKVFSDPYSAYLLTFVSPDNNWQMSVRFINLELPPWTNQNDKNLTLTIYPFVPEGTNVLPTLSSTFSSDNLSSSLGGDASSLPILGVGLIPGLVGSHPQYTIFKESALFLGLYLYTGISKQSTGSYYVEGFTSSEAQLILEWWESNYTESFLDEYINIYYSDSRPGFGVRLAYLGDGSFIVAGVRVYSEYTDFADAKQQIQDLAYFNNSEFDTLILSYIQLLPNINSTSFETCQVIIREESTTREKRKYEIDLIGANQEVATSFADSLFATNYEWRAAGDSTVAASWKITKYLSLDQYVWFVVTVAYFEDGGVAILISIR